MFGANLSVLRTLCRQAGPVRAALLTLAKVIRRILAPESQFHYAQTGEDLVLASLVERLLGRRSITYVDVGCHDARRISTTYLHYLAGSSGLGVDLGPQYAKSWRKFRRRDTFVCEAVSDRAGRAVVVEHAQSAVDTIDAGQAKRWAAIWPSTGNREVQTACLRDIVRDHLPGRTVDVLLLDVEGHELSVLKGAHLESMLPGLIVCEVHGLDLLRASENEVVQYLSEKGYRLLAYATMNAYFARQATLSARGL